MLMISIAILVVLLLQLFVLIALFSIINNILVIVSKQLLEMETESESNGYFRLSYSGRIDEVIKLIKARM